MKTWYTIKAAANPEVDADEMTIFDEIGGWGVSAATFNRDFRALKSPRVTLYINSPGGNVIQALAIFNTISQSDKVVTAHVMGIAASAAAYVVLACDKIVMPENTFQFLHDPLAGLHGDADDHREVADMLDKFGASLMATYCKRTGKPEAEIRALLRADSLLTAAECKALGLCDETLAEVSVTAKFDYDRPDLPEQVKALFKAKASTVPTLALTTTFGEQIVAMAKQADLAEFASAWAVDDTLTTIEAVQARILAAREIKGIAQAVGRAEDAPALIRTGKTLAEARASMKAALVATDKPIDTAAQSKQMTDGSFKDFSVTALWDQINSKGTK